MDSAFVPPVWKRTTAASASTCRGGGRRVTRALPCSYRSRACTHSIGVASSRFASSLPCSPSFRPTCKTSVFRFLAVARATGRSEHHVVAVSRPEEVECDVCIVGGGPAGCTCALYTSRAELKTIVLDKNNTTGALAITSTIANYPGVDKTMPGQQLLNEMQKQAEDFGTDYRRAQVFLVDVQGEYKYVYTPDATFKARALVLSTGAMGRKPSFKGEGELQLPRERAPVDAARLEVVERARRSVQLQRPFRRREVRCLNSNPLLVFEIGKFAT